MNDLSSCCRANDAARCPHNDTNFPRGCRKYEPQRAEIEARRLAIARKTLGDSGSITPRIVGASAPPPAGERTGEAGTIACIMDAIMGYHARTSNDGTNMVQSFAFGMARTVYEALMAAREIGRSAATISVRAEGAGGEAGRVLGDAQTEAAQPHREWTPQDGASPSSPSSAPDEIEGLVEGWRDHRKKYRNIWGDGAFALVCDGDRMAAALAKLKGERDTTEEACRLANQSTVAAITRADAAGAETDRLAEQLRQVETELALRRADALGASRREAQAVSALTRYKAVAEAAQPFAAAYERCAAARYGKRVAAAKTWFTDMPGHWPIDIEVTMQDAHNLQSALASLPTADTAKGGE